MRAVARPPAHVLHMGIDAIAAVSALATTADDRQVLASQIAQGVRSVHEADPGHVLLRVRISVDTLQALEEATEVAMPDPTPH